jgi:hypothetical protein
MLLVACESKPELNKFCGVDLTKAETTRLQTTILRGTIDDSKKLNANQSMDISWIANEVVKHEVFVKVVYNQWHPDSIGINISGPLSELQARRLSCYFLSGKNGDVMPKNRWLLIYDERTLELITASHTP